MAKLPEAIRSSDESQKVWSALEKATALIMLLIGDTTDNVRLW